MATKHVIGLKYITMGPPAADGGMGTDLVEVFGETVRGTAIVESTEPTRESIYSEESKLAIDNIETDPGAFTFKASTYNISPLSMQFLFGGSVSGANGIATTGTVVGGTGYVNGTYTNVPLTGGTGRGAKATVVVSGGSVTTVTITSKGIGYTALDSLTASAANLGGTGSGFSVPAATVASTAPNWKAPADGSRPDIEMSVVAESQNGVKYKVVRMKLAGSLAISFDAARLGQLNWTGTVLQPTKANTEPMEIEWPA